MENLEQKVIIYEISEGIHVEVQMGNDTIWLSQRQMGELFDKDTDTIGLHLKNIYKTNELSEKATTEYFSVVQKEGNRRVRRKIRFYNLDAIISVGYRVNSRKGTQFRIWANQVLKSYLIEGFAINERRLAQKVEQLSELQRIVALQSNILQKKQLSNKIIFQLFLSFNKIRF